MNKKLASLVIVVMLVFTAFAGATLVSAQSVDTGTDNGTILNGSSNLNATDTTRTIDANSSANLNSTTTENTTNNTTNTTNTTNLNSTTTGGTVQNQNAPGVPATGMGGDTVLNLTILVLSAIVLLGGVAYMSRASVR